MKKSLLVIIVLFLIFSSCGKKDDSTKVSGDKTTTVQADATKIIAKNAYIYGYPMAMLYGIIYNYNVDTKSPDYKGPFNKIVNIPRVFTPADKAVVTPNSDTPYSILTLDLRAEPIVISVPQIEKNRYYSIMFLDLYTYIYEVAGTRTPYC